jgi:hypothetical protein
MVAASRRIRATTVGCALVTLLPVFSDSAAGFQGGWMAIPGGQLSQDSSASFSGSNGLLKTAVQPALNRPAGRCA